MTNATDALRDALYNLHELTQCRCHDDYKSRGRIDPDCNHDYREDVDALQAEVARLREGIVPRGDDMIVPVNLLDEINATGAAWKARAETAEAEAARLRVALTLAYSHLDMTALRVSHCKDAATIYTALESAGVADAAMGSANGQG